ncbi:hypothetical protein [Ligilactobacillus murinus]|nr:hypothetical protein [Ligilactobacillus murinus]
MLLKCQLLKPYFLGRDNLGFIFIELMAKQNIAEVSQKVAIFLKFGF